MLLLASALLGGIAAVLVLEELPARTLLVALVPLAAAAWRLRLAWVAAAVAGFVLGAAQGHRLLTMDWPCGRDREVIPLRGTVMSPAEQRPGRVDFDFRPDAAGRAAGVPAKLRLSWYEPQATPLPGESWRFEARLRCRSGLANPGGYDRELALLREGYGATGYASGSATRLGRDRSAAPLAAARAWLAAEIERAARHTRSAGVLQGLSVGLRGSIPQELRDAFVATGTAHLIAISGMHVTAFALVALLLSRLGYRLLGRPALSAGWPALQAAIVLSVTAAYGLLAGASLPTVRTVAMVAIAAAVRIARREAGIDRVLPAAAVGLVAADPLSLTSAGFWLSFTAVAALVSLAAAAPGPAALVRTFVRAQAAVTLMLAPVLAAAFGAISLVGPLANALAIPLFSFAILPVTLAGTALLPVWPSLAARIWAMLGESLDRCWTGLTALADLPWATFSPPQPPLWLVGASLAAAAAALLVPGPAAKWLAACVLGSLLLRPGPAPQPGDFEIAVLDVGHGLASVLRTASHALVFDTGPAWRGGGSAARVALLPYLRAAGVRSVDTVIVSHADHDHAGGLAALTAAVPVRRVLGGEPLPGGGDAEPCHAGEEWSWDGVRLRVVHPPRGVLLEGNDASCALHVASSAGAALLLADTERRGEAMMRGWKLAADVVLVPHHGSASSSTPALVHGVGASHALVSNGFGNRWGLPRQEVADRWRAAGASLHTTGTAGAILVRVSAGGQAPEVVHYRDVERRWWRRRN